MWAIKGLVPDSVSGGMRLWVFGPAGFVHRLQEVEGACGRALLDVAIPIPIA